MKSLKQFAFAVSVLPMAAILIPALALFLGSMALVVVAACLAHIVTEACDV